jgi:lysophospholipase L1-like esterase
MRAEFVNLASLSAFETADFSSDGLHPSEQGYNKIAAIWFRIIRADLP